MNTYFTDSQIINQICKERIKLAEKRDNKHYTTRLIGGRNPNGRPHLLDTLLPPRRAWNAFRPRKRSVGGNANLAALRLAVHKLRQEQPELAWVRNLNCYIANIQKRVMGNSQFAFAKPAIGWLPKPEKKHEYRALCIFELQDNIIAILFAQYIRDAFDPAFSRSSYAFRARNQSSQMPNHHAAFNALYQLKTADLAKDFYVAEADITGFFDTLDHSVALAAFDSASTVHPIAPRAREIFQAYLNCYSFAQNVLEEAEPGLKCEKGQAAYFSKPKAVSGQSGIGVPQGGAVSGIIANLVLDRADKSVELERDRLGAEIHYFRYCDDMILLSPVKAHCAAVFSVYLAALDQLKLPYHKPEKTWIYGKQHWDHKSKSVYRWSGQKWFGCAPWIQFVGYQVRYDGLVRVRKGAFKTQSRKFAEYTSKIKHRLILASQSRALAVTRAKAMNSFTAKLLARGVGWTDSYSQGPKPMCWAGGFMALHQKPLVTSVLRKLDSLRQRQIMRFGDSNINFTAGAGIWDERKLRDPRNSYFAQFKDRSGRSLIETPWLPQNWKESVMATHYLDVKSQLEGMSVIAEVRNVIRLVRALVLPKVKVYVGEHWGDTKFRRRNRIYVILEVDIKVKCCLLMTDRVKYIPRTQFGQRFVKISEQDGTICIQPKP